MPLTKDQKQKIIEKIKENLERKKSIFFINFQGMKAKEIFDLRKTLKEKMALLYVAKKKLIEFAFKEKKIPLDVGKLEGEIGLVFAFGDEILPVKTVYNFWKEYKVPEILGGIFDDEWSEKEKVIELAKLPSREELLGRLVGSLNAPIFNLKNVLEGNIKGLIFILAKFKTNS